MVNVISIKSDEILIVETENRIKKYAVGDDIEFRNIDGFVIKGNISNINKNNLTIYNGDTYNCFDVLNICAVSE